MGRMHGWASMGRPILFSTVGSAHGACVLLHCGGCRVARNAEFRTPFDGAYLGRVFPSFAVSSVFVRGCWEEGQSGTLCR